MAAKKPEKKRPKRQGKKHKGVVLLPPQAKKRMMRWRARYLDPEAPPGVKRHKYESLPAELTTAPQREHWAAMKADELAARRLALALGALPATGRKLSDAVDRYFKDHPRLGERTVEGYRGVANKLVAWGGREGVVIADDLTRARLMEFRGELVREPKQRAAKGNGAGRRKVATKELRAPERVNTELRRLGTVLRYLIDATELSKLSHDDVRRAVKRLDVPKERITFLRPHEIQKSLEAALRHDAKMFVETRKEHAGLRPKGTTLRYAPIAPFVAFCLLTGARLGEALALEWSQVDLDALDTSGAKVGEIHLAGVRLKTKQYRDIDLSVSPALRSMLAAMKLASGGKGSVFELTESLVEAAAKRLKAEHGAPGSFGWQALRRTCGTFLTNAPGIFGAASAYRSAKQLGHSVQVAEKHYLGVLKGISAGARTLEEAMQIQQLIAQVTTRVRSRSDRAASRPAAG